MGAIVFNRKTGDFYNEKQYGEKSLSFLYETLVGRIILKLFISGKMYSRYNARRNSSPASIKKIQPFIEDYNINMGDFEEREYSSFCDFFVRKIRPNARPLPSDENALIAVADSKLLCYPINESSEIHIKNSIYTVGELTGNPEDENSYRDGVCLVFRLTVDDYHHYCYFDDGRLLSKKYIKGRLHTVGPISAKRHKVFSENCREVSYIETAHFGNAVQIEVGALLVGKINNYSNTTFKRGEEKGYFEMGGSTCVVLLKKDAADIDKDITENSAKGIECKVLLGEKIGVRRT